MGPAGALGGVAANACLTEEGPSTTFSAELLMVSSCADLRFIPKESSPACTQQINQNKIEVTGRASSTSTPRESPNVKPYFLCLPSPADGSRLNSSAFSGLSSSGSGTKGSIVLKSASPFQNPGRFRFNLTCSFSSRERNTSSKPFSDSTSDLYFAPGNTRLHRAD